MGDKILDIIEEFENKTLHTKSKPKPSKKKEPISKDLIEHADFLKNNPVVAKKAQEMRDRYRCDFSGSNVTQVKEDSDSKNKYFLSVAGEGPEKTDFSSPEIGKELELESEQRDFKDDLDAIGPYLEAIGMEMRQWDFAKENNMLESHLEDIRRSQVDARAKNKRIFRIDFHDPYQVDGEIRKFELIESYLKKAIELDPDSEDLRDGYSKWRLRNSAHYKYLKRLRSVIPTTDLVSSESFSQDLITRDSFMDEINSKWKHLL